VSPDTTQVDCAQESRKPKPHHDRRTDILTATVANRENISEFIDEWQELSSNSLVANPFYEPWMLLPALQYLADDRTVAFVLVFGRSKPSDPEKLWGLFPLEIKSKTLHLPISCISFWQHQHCFLATPLIHRDYVHNVLLTFWQWLENNPFHCKLFDTSYLLADGPFHQQWSDIVIGRLSLPLNLFPRAFLKPDGDFTEYVAKAISKKHLDEFARLERRLRDSGKVEFRWIELSDEVDKWLNDFLCLETSGWKGTGQGSAIAKSEEEVDYLRSITRAGFQAKRIMLLSLEFDGKPIAMKYNLLASSGGFAFKIAFDERYSKYSPGVLLELDNIRRVCTSDRIEWFDSCAAPRHVMANRLWSERRMISRTLFSNGSKLGDFLISALPFLRWLGKRMRPADVPAYLQILRK
jgi:hypothetical protein